jgi:L-lactate utilization protein LutB
MQPRTLELNDWLSEKKCRKLVDNLNARHFKATYCATSQEAADYILAEAQTARSIGFGGSLSVADLKLTTPLREQGKEILNHGFPDLTPEQRVEIMKRQLTCDLFLSGTNAATLDGCLVNIDGNGNRVAAMIYGPSKVIVVVGRNKIVEGDIGDAIKRVKDKASPPNAMRLGKKTPCATTGFCCDCDSPQRICHVTTIIDSKPSQTDFHVLVVNEDMGL